MSEHHVSSLTLSIFPIYSVCSESLHTPPSLLVGGKHRWKLTLMKVSNPIPVVVMAPEWAGPEFFCLSCQGFLCAWFPVGPPLSLNPLCAWPGLPCDWGGSALGEQGRRLHVCVALSIVWSWNNDDLNRNPKRRSGHIWCEAQWRRLQCSDTAAPNH